MTIEFIITDNTVELLSNTDTGENALIINGVEIPSTSWVGSGYYVYDGISIKKISSLSGNVFCNKISDTEYELAAKNETSYVTSVNGQTGIVNLDADDIPYNLTQSVGDAIDSNITAISNRALKTNIAKVEPSNTALYRHEVGTYFINKDGNMCRATSLIQVGNTITVNSNCVVVDVGGEISQINNDLSHISDVVSTIYDTNYFDSLTCLYSHVGHIFVAVGSLHVKTVKTGWVGAIVTKSLPQGTGNYRGSGVAYNSTSGGIAYIQMDTEGMWLINFDKVGWYRFSFCYLH